MTYILHIESSTSVCSVSLAKEGKLVDSKANFNGQNHAKLIGVFIDQLFQDNDISASQLAAVAVSEGPGSYTGLRIGTSHAKGMCYAQQIPLLVINPLQTLCEQALQRNCETIEDKETAVFIALMDARRMEVYTASFNSKCEAIGEVEAKVIDEDSFGAEYPDREIVIFGNGAAKCVDVLKHPKVRYVADVHCHANDMCRLAFDAYRKAQFADVAYFEPFYLKDFIAGTPKKSVLERL
ncbi:MAG: tRNA (adenosine(37)-N6)-threonylcarbamoyltransferase complex dimerization subunit type 1 TsaB [Mangrovibacterium sp.]